MENEPMPKPSSFILLPFLCLLFLGATPTNTHAGTPPELYYEIDTSLLSGNTIVDEVGFERLLRSINERLGTLGHAKESADGQIIVRLEKGIDPVNLGAIKRRIQTLGNLEFRFLADAERPEDQSLIKLARNLPLNKKKVTVGQLVVAQWVTYSEEEFLQGFAKSLRYVERLTDHGAEALMLMDMIHLDGTRLTSAEKKSDGKGSPALKLSFDPKGSSLLNELTSHDKVVSAPKQERFLCLVMDKNIMGATCIQESLDSDILIIGMTEHYADAILAILHEGVLPYPLREVQQ